jgi:L-aspartate oxidase
MTRDAGSDEAFDVLVLGGGVAGLSAAIRAARAGARVAVVTKAALGASATQYAQGGVAAVLPQNVLPQNGWTQNAWSKNGWDEDATVDSPDLHLADTLVAGAGLCDVDAVRVMVEEGPTRVNELIAMGAHFDQSDGGLAFTREGGHTLPRILHAGGDATGAEIERALVEGVQATAAVIRERWFAVDVLIDGERAVGVRALDPDAAEREIRARHTVIATGGAGQCYAVTTNPSISTGDGIAMALRAGVAVSDVEFMQFHPTALHHPSMPRPLLSEALRGEGAILRDENGVAFMASEHPLGDLAPRDVVARAIARRVIDRGLSHLWLDARPIASFETRFPTVWRACRAVGLDPRHDLLPVAPAAHYLSGGVCTDLDGATTLRGLWACGEAADSGVHGANRLASNSLLDGLVFGARCVDAIAAGRDAAVATGVMRGLAPWHGIPAPHEPQADRGDRATSREDLQQLMTREAGVLRDATSLERARDALDSMAPRTPVVRNLWSVSRALVAAAFAREESRGTHTRLDWPETDDRFLGRFVFDDSPDPAFVPLPVGEPAR